MVGSVGELLGLESLAYGWLEEGGSLEEESWLEIVSIELQMEAWAETMTLVAIYLEAYLAPNHQIELPDVCLG